MFERVYFRNFKSLRRFALHLKTMNVLVGPNNAGKSTILDAFRVVVAAHETASHRLPQNIRVKGETIVGYEIPAAQIPIPLTNIHSDYESDQETSVTFVLDNKNELKLNFYDSARCILTFDSYQHIGSTADFRKSFPTFIYSFPTLGPLEEEEELLTDQYVRRWVGTRRSHRMFRNIWYRWPHIFPMFQNLVEQTWAGMTISKPELNTA